MNIQSEDDLKKAYKLIETCSTDKAAKILNEALRNELGEQNLVFAIQCCGFWQKIFETLPQLEYFEQGETLITQWKQFATIIEREKAPLEHTVYSFKKGVFSLALDRYNRAGNEKDVEFTAEICRKKGLCYKKLGSYETALNWLKEANATAPNQAPVLAEIADCYALCGETRQSKALFREAFFINASKVDLDFLDSPFIKILVEKVKEKGYSGEILKEWIPVYGAVLGAFSIKRDLHSQEVLHLRQEIYAKESELKLPYSNTSVLTPQLLNLYLWLIDYQVLKKESISKINEILLKIKILDENIYSMLVRD